MTASVKQYYEDIESTGFASYLPCDTSRVWTLVDNVQHLLESSPRYIVNMSSGVYYPASALAPQWEGSDFIARLDMAWTIPVCVLDIGKFPCWDVRLAASVTSAAATNSLGVSVSIGNMFMSPPGNVGDPNVFGVLAGLTTSATPAYIIDGRIVPPNSSTMTGAVVPTIDLQTGSNVIQCYYFYARIFLSMYCIVHDISDVIYLDALQIREYPPA